MRYIQCMAKPPTNYPADEIQRLFDAVHACLEQKKTHSVAEALGAVFVPLRQSGNWGYSWPQTRAMAGQFTAEQQQQLASHFTPPPPDRGSMYHVRAHRLAEESLRHSFLTDAARDPSRPHLAVKYDLPLEAVSLALERPRPPRSF